jgi:hypothetical protein
LALLKIALWRAPALSTASLRRTLVMTFTVPQRDVRLLWGIAVVVSWVQLVVAFGDLRGLKGLRAGSSLSGSGRTGGGFVLFTYLRRSQCRCKASISRSRALHWCSAAPRYTLDLLGRGAELLGRRFVLTGFP